MLIYNFILQDWQATPNEARAAAYKMVWSEMEQTEQTIKYKQYIDTVNGIAIYYDYGADYYFFTDSE